MIQLEVFRVEVWDGGDRHNLSFRISSKEEADKWKKLHPHDHICPETIVVFESLEEQKENETITVRRRVWDRLSPNERVAIGMRERP